MVRKSTVVLVLFSPILNTITKHNKTMLESLIKI